MEFIHSRTQHPVGQGGFHSATIKTPVISKKHAPYECAEFNYVYDCGAMQKNHCKNIVEKFAFERSRKLDFLFISHLDDDHINAIPVLIDQLGRNSIDTIVMPFIDDDERILALARARGRRKTISPFFQDLVVDPVQALSELGPRRIIFVQSGAIDPDDGGTVEISPIGDPDAPISVKIRPDLDTDGAFGSQRARVVGGGVHPDAQVIGDDMVFEVRQGDCAWILKPYVRKFESRLIQQFKRAVERRLGWSIDTFDEMFRSRQRRESVVRNPDVLAEIYKAVFRNRNLTSLSLLSRPAQSGGELFDSWAGRGAWERYYDTQKCGWIGTGDAPLRSRAESAAFLQHFQAHLDSVTTYMFPHHGSIKNHSIDIISRLSPRFCVAAAKPKSNWKHPHPRVCAESRTVGAKVVHVSNKLKSRFSERFIGF